MSKIRWHLNRHDCNHTNSNVCRTCDFDGFYKNKYDDCPWKDKT